MLNYAQTIRERRLFLGFTQTELSRLSHTSLPTIQNIEGGRANPCCDVLTTIFKSLGLELHITIQPADWDYLSKAGVPIQSGSSSKNESVSIGRLFKELCLAAEESESLTSAESARKKEALQSFLLAIKTHFPTTFKKRVLRAPVLTRLTPSIFDGRMIKLSRIARDSLSHYL